MSKYIPVLAVALLIYSSTCNVGKCIQLYLPFTAEMSMHFVFNILCHPSLTVPEVLRCHVYMFFHREIEVTAGREDFQGLQAQLDLLELRSVKCRLPRSTVKVICLLALCGESSTGGVKQRSGSEGSHSNTEV